MGYYENSYSAQFQRRFKVIKGLSSGDFAYGRTVYAEGVDKVRQNIATLLTINPGDVFFNPTLGSSLEPYLFEPNDFILKDTLTRYLVDAITSNIKDIEINDIEITCQDIYIIITLKYTILSIGYYDEFSILKTRGERVD